MSLRTAKPAPSRTSRLTSSTPSTRSCELGEIDLAMRGGFVADIAVLAQFEGAIPVLAIEALTIEEPEAEPVSRAAPRAG